MAAERCPQAGKELLSTHARAVLKALQELHAPGKRKRWSHGVPSPDR